MSPPGGGLSMSGFIRNSFLYGVSVEILDRVPIL